MPLVEVHKNSLRSSRGRRYAVLLPFSLLGKVCPGIAADALVRPTARDTGADRSAMGGIRHGPASRPCHPARRSRRARAGRAVRAAARRHGPWPPAPGGRRRRPPARSEEHTSELQSRPHLVCRLLLEKKNNTAKQQEPKMNKKEL